MGVVSSLMSIRSGKGGGDGAASGVASIYKANRAKQKSNEPAPDQVDSYHRGGKVRKTGLANLKKGEVVLTEKQAKARKNKRKRSRSRSRSNSRR